MCVHTHTQTYMSYVCTHFTHDACIVILHNMPDYSYDIRIYVHASMRPCIHASTHPSIHPSILCRPSLQALSVDYTWLISNWAHI